MGFNNFLIMPPAYYKYSDEEVINFYSKIINEINDCKIILYNFEKLSGYKFSVQCVENLVKKFPNQIIGVKDSSYNLFETLKNEMSGNYPELKRAESLIKETLRMEEEKFLVLLDRGIKILNDEISKIDKVLPGDIAFKLYET